MQRESFFEDQGSVHFYLNIFCCGFNQEENYRHIQ